jgi:hypothetical protein
MLDHTRTAAAVRSVTTLAAWPVTARAAGTGGRLVAMGGGAVIESRPFLSHKAVSNGFSF